MRSASEPASGTTGNPSEQGVLQAHGFHRLKVKRVIEEAVDARSFVLEPPAGMEELFRYRSGQFCTFRVSVGGAELLRSYSMSSAPDTDPELTVTVKRVPGGVVSNWLLDEVGPGDELEATRPAGVFCLGEGSGEVVAFCGGSGVTPVISITKSALATTTRDVLLLYANRDPDAVIFRSALEALRLRYDSRIDVTHHFDSESGFPQASSVADIAARAPAGDFYICGPAPFMDLVESTLLAAGVSPAHIFVERFVAADAAEPRPTPPPAPDSDGGEVPVELTILINGRQSQVAYQPGETILVTARRGRLNPPSSCESGECATCMAILREGTARMRLNNALSPEEVAEGWILTCQAVPSSAVLTVEYESL